VIDATNAHVRAVVRPGDVVAIRPQWMRSLVQWNLGVERAGGEHAVAPPVPDSFAMRLAGRPTGRVWLIEWAGDRVVVHGTTRCARPWNKDSTRVRCIVAQPPG
jgi:hypothetical protein